MIEIIKSAAAEITIDPKEVAVYLGYYSANGIGKSGGRKYTDRK